MVLPYFTHLTLLEHGDSPYQRLGFDGKIPELNEGLWERHLQMII